MQTEAISNQRVDLIWVWKASVFYTQQKKIKGRGFHKSEYPFRSALIQQKISLRIPS